MTKNRLFFLTFFILVILLVISALPVPIMMNAAKYAQVAREVLANGDWINLTIGGVPYEQKPPMLFWVGAVCFQVFGFSIPAYKLSVIFMSLLGLYSTFRIGKLFYGEKVGLLAAMFTCSSLSYLHFHNDIHTDTLLVSFVTFSVWQLMAFLEEKKWHQFLLGIMGIGFSMLTKGPVGVLIPAFAVGASLVYHKRWREIFHVRWLLAIPIIGIIILPALIGLLNQFGLEGIKFYFWTNNMGRVTGSYYGDSNDYTFYLHTSLYMLLPWTIFMIVAMFNELKGLLRIRKGGSKMPVEVANIASVIFFVGILSVAKQKNPHYLLSAVPFIFIITAKWCVEIFENRKEGRKANIIVIVNKVVALLLLGMVPVISLFFFHQKSVLYWIAIAVLFVVVVFFVIQKLDLKKQMIMMLLAFSALLFSLNVTLLPRMFQYHSSIDAAEVFNAKADEGATLNMYGEKARLWNLLLYADSYGKYIETREELDSFLPGTNDWLFLTQEAFEELQEMNVDMEVVKEYKKHKKLTSQSLNFLIPNSRAARFRTVYLVRLK